MTEPKPPTGEHTPLNITIPSGTGAVVSAGTEAVERMSRFTPQQVVVIGSVVSMIVTNVLLIWLLVDTRNDRRDERKSQSEQASALHRGMEEAREKDRQFVSIERNNDRKDSTDKQKMILDHCTNQVEKTNKFISALTNEVSKIVKKDPEEFINYDKSWLQRLISCHHNSDCILPP